MAPKAKHTASKKAAVGKGCDPAKLSKMIGLLKYNSQKAKDQEKKDDAQRALNIYQQLGDPEERARFLQVFESSGGGKAPGALKFAVTFEQKVDSSKTTEVAQVENWLTRLVITCIPCIIVNIITSPLEELLPPLEELLLIYHY